MAISFNNMRSDSVVLTELSSFSDVVDSDEPGLKLVSEFSSSLTLVDVSSSVSTIFCKKKEIFWN